MKNKNILLRLLVSPFILGMMIITYFYGAIKRWLYFLKYGGEFINFDKDKDENITIQKIYELLKQQYEN